MSTGVAWLLVMNDHGLPILSRSIGRDAPSVTFGIVNTLYAAAQQGGTRLGAVISEDAVLAYNGRQGCVMSVLTSRRSAWGSIATEAAVQNFISLLYEVLTVAIGHAQWSNLISSPFAHSTKPIRARLQELQPMLDNLLGALVKPVTAVGPQVFPAIHTVASSLCLDATVPHLFVAEYAKAVGVKAAAVLDKGHTAVTAATDAWWSWPCVTINALIVLAHAALDAEAAKLGKSKGATARDDGSSAVSKHTLLSQPLSMLPSSEEAAVLHTLITVPVSFDVPSDELECSGLSGGPPHRDSGLVIAFIVPSQSPDTVATVCRKIVDAFARTPVHVARRLYSALQAQCTPPNPLLDSIHLDSSRFVFESIPDDYRPGAHAEVFGFVLETDCQDDKGCIRTSTTRLHNEDPFSLTSAPSQHLNLHYSMTSCMQTCDTLPANVTDFYIRGKEFVLSWLKLEDSRIVVAFSPNVPACALEELTLGVHRWLLSSVSSWTTNPALTRLNVVPI